MARRCLGIAVLLLLLALGCGSEQSRMERGVAVDPEVADPSSDEQMAMTEEERREEEAREEGRASQADFDEVWREGAP